MSEIARGRKSGIGRAKELLGDFSSFWVLETEPSEQRKLLLSLSEQI
jgi:hypothetical protein